MPNTTWRAYTESSHIYTLEKQDDGGKYLISYFPFAYKNMQGLAHLYNQSSSSYTAHANFTPMGITLQNVKSCSKARRSAGEGGEK